ncbi:MAG TPA: endopeptidase La [Planctomycetota bacterium]|nr:endopeptidase La [Planctomycetota bacterium]
MKKRELLPILPLVPMKGAVLFPHMVMPVSVGRAPSLAAVEEALSSAEKELIVTSQRDPAADEPPWSELYHVGTKAVIRRVSRSDGRIDLVLQGIDRVDLIEERTEATHRRAAYRVRTFLEEPGPEVEALRRELLELSEKLASLSSIPDAADAIRLLARTNETARFLFFAISMLSLSVEESQSLLEAKSLLEALKLAHSHFVRESKILEVRRQISSQAQTEISKQQREFLLRQQLQAIQQELGEERPEQAEVRILRDRLAQAKLPEEVRKEAERELAKLEKLSPMSPEHGVTRSYLELVMELPWDKSTEAELDLSKARRILDEDHFGLEEIKDRILEHLGVLKLNPKAKAPILCFVGPPGVGKTSLGKSIARALGRTFERMSLGGLHDESELRGHRRTYIGAMPGRLLQAIRRARVNNPVLMLDEVDKLGRDFRGDPAAALLEVLDPEQNAAFRDNYLDLPFDLSKVFFVTTANALDPIPAPLLDRMEVIFLSGYSEEEKIEIARRYVIPRQLREAGLRGGEWEISPEALRFLISRYTREAGVRQLERAIARLLRKAALLRTEKGVSGPFRLEIDDLTRALGPAMFFQEQVRGVLPAGVSAGLAWTESGGDVLYVEAALVPEREGITMTGQLGPVMQESARAAQSFVLSHAAELGIDRTLLKGRGVHLHVPAGAIPKDGPSAGVTIAAAFSSLYTGRPLRSDTAMTGEMTLTGLVLPVGGIREKVLAARRAGFRRVVLPKQNEKDLAKLPDSVRSAMEFILADEIQDVFNAVLLTDAPLQRKAG